MYEQIFKKFPSIKFNEKLSVFFPLSKLEEN
jgi:hypothetical protein